MGEQEEFIKKLNGLVGHTIDTKDFAEGLLNPETRRGLLENHSFEDEDIEILMGIEAEDISQFSLKTFEAFNIPFSPGKERE